MNINKQITNEPKNKEINRQEDTHKQTRGLTDSKKNWKNGNKH